MNCNNKWVLRVLALGVGVMLAPGIADADGFRNPPETARALSLDGGKLTSVQDASAMAANPANLSALESPDAVLALTLIRGETKYTSALGSAKTDDPWKALPNAFLRFRLIRGVWSPASASRRRSASPQYGKMTAFCATPFRITRSSWW
ncbi:MAG: hypothetical protein M5U15_07065 [Kiritimatiellae bacterium]|nr:hypothetical protein [Kiritimatiellia bacterium]